MSGLRVHLNAHTAVITVVYHYEFTKFFWHCGFLCSFSIKHWDFERYICYNSILFLVQFFLTSYVPDLLYWVRLKMLCCRKMWRKLSFSWSKVYLKMRKADQKKPCHSTQTLWPCVLPQYVLQCRMVFCSVLVFLFIVAMHIFFKKCWVLWTLFRPRIFLMATSRPNYTNWQGKP